VSIQARFVAKKQKQIAIQTSRIFFTEVIPRPNVAAAGGMLSSALPSKDEVEYGNTASMTRGGPAARTREMG